MFTGIVSAVGRIVDVRSLGAGASFGKGLTLESPPGWIDGVAIGDSIALAGACMTVVSLEPLANRFAVEVSAESLAATAGLDTKGDINLEKALRAGDRLDGHLVSGHIDGVGLVTAIDDLGASWRLEIDAPKELARFVARKGSITVNGVSLTVNKVSDTANGNALFEINIIPHTHQVTTIRLLRKGAKVNLEIDLLARYVERMLVKDLV